PGRSPARSMRAMAATSHPLATEAALKIMRDQGGNAVDAAIAASAVQAVVEPQSTGIGGDCFALVAMNGGTKVEAINGSGWSPEKATIAALQALGVGDEIEQTSPHAVTVPGCVDAWGKLQKKFGKLNFADVLAPAIYYAEKGFVVTDRVSWDWASNVSMLNGNAASSAAYLVGGAAPKAGAVHKLEQLGKTLRILAEEGSRSFYSGSVADNMVASLNAIGGLHTLDDFESFESQFVTPISLDYKGLKIWECPPNGQGVIALMILNILAQLEDLGQGPSSAKRLHIEAEAARLAYSVRDRMVTDPEKVEVPVEWMLSTELAKQLAGEIDTNARNNDLPEISPNPHKDTVYISVVDEDRNCVSLINSTFHSFGSGITCPETGVVFQNRGMSFSMKAEHANALAPRKRPMHTIIPGMITKGDKAVGPFGVMGGHYQALGHAHFITGISDFGLDPQEAIDMPRVMFGPGQELNIEDATGQRVRDGLAAKGHKLVRPETPIGGAQAILIS
ncbi:MAG: gamma-glutamyltransferase family protein, partial [Alphaproteobacteria bacterium]